MVARLPKLIATDLDGTLLRRDGTVSARTLRALRTVVEAGADIVVVTAPPPRYVDALATATGLGGTAICSNGALVYDLASRTVIHSRPLAVSAARTVATVLGQAVPGIGFAVEAGLRVHYEPAYTMRHSSDREAEFAVPSVAHLWTVESPILNPPPAEAGGFLAHVGCGSATSSSYTINTSRVETSPVLYGKAWRCACRLGSRSARCALGSRNARTPYPIMWAVFRPGGETPFPALLRRGPIPPRPEGRGVLGDIW
ncbi:HAD family hydrolase [Streptomyces sp. NPDC055722]